MGDQRPQLIERIFAWVCPDGEGGEGVAGASIGMTMMPLVGADQERMESLRPIAQDICNRLGRPIMLVEFSVRRDVETIEPAKRGS